MKAENKIAQNMFLRRKEQGREKIKFYIEIGSILHRTDSIENTKSYIVNGMEETQWISVY